MVVPPPPPVGVPPGMGGVPVPPPGMGGVPGMGGATWMLQGVVGVAGDSMACQCLFGGALLFFSKTFVGVTGVASAQKDGHEGREGS